MDHNGFHIHVVVIVFAEEVIVVIGISVEGVFRTEKFDKLNFTLALR